MTTRPSGNRARDRGAVAVEFALLLPILLLLVFGMIDFGRALNYQITLTQAAREGARLAALYPPSSLTCPTACVVTKTQQAWQNETQLSQSSVTVTVPSSCLVGAGSTAYAMVTTSYVFTFVTPVGAFAAMFGGSSLGSPITLTATGVMPCET
jgi:TadE-like protein